MIRRLLMTLALGAAILAPAAANAGPLRAGAARVDITPPPALRPAPALLPMTSVHDPIYARVLVLDNGEDKAVLIAVDAIIVVGFGDLLDDIAKELEIPRDHILVSATHDHNAPAVGTPGGYFDFFKKGVMDAVRQASASARPARIGYRTGAAYVNVNRDERVGDRYVMGYAPDGPSDKTVAVMTVTDTAGKPIAVYANYPVHGVVMFGSKTGDGQFEITGDLPGATARYVEERLGKDVVALWTSGAAGDQNPILSAAYVDRDGKIRDRGAAGFAILDGLARRLGDEILRVVENTGETAGSADFRVRTTALACPGQKPRPGAKPLPSKIPGGPAIFETVDAAPVDIPLTLMTIGDIALAGVGGELFTEIGMAIKAQSPFDRTIVVTNLPDGVGYIPSERGFSLPSDKATGARMKPGCAEAGIPATFKALGTEILAASAPKK